MWMFECFLKRPQTSHSGSVPTQTYGELPRGQDGAGSLKVSVPAGPSVAVAPNNFQSGVERFRPRNSINVLSEIDVYNIYIYIYMCVNILYTYKYIGYVLRGVCLRNPRYDVSKEMTLHISAFAIIRSHFIHKWKMGGVVAKEVWREVQTNFLIINCLTFDENLFDKFFTSHPLSLIWNIVCFNASGTCSSTRASACNKI